jgi:hypothetical protein
MLNLSRARPMLIALTACATSFIVQGNAFADDAQENKVLKEQMRQMMQRMDALQKQVEQLSKQQAAMPPPAVVVAPPPPPAIVPAPVVAAAPVVKYEEKEPLLHKILSGFYGTLDVSFDDTTKGMNGFVAYPYSLVDPTNPNSGYVRGATPKGGQGRRRRSGGARRLHAGVLNQ